MSESKNDKRDELAGLAILLWVAVGVILYLSTDFGMTLSYALGSLVAAGLAEMLNEDH